MSLAAFSRCFAWSDDPDMMFCHRGQSSSDKNHCYEQGREEAAVSHSVSDQTTDLFHSKEGGRCFHCQRPLRTAWCSLSQEWQECQPGRSRPMEWGILDWAGTLNTILML